MDATLPEGVIQFQLKHNKKAIGFTKEAAVLDSFRSVFKKIKLIGRDKSRYQGFGFGNLSIRVSPSSFVISASQTGHMKSIFPDSVALVTGWDFNENFLVFSEGMKKPSSESLTHAAVYDSNPGINAVIHVHSPTIFCWAQKANYPSTEETSGCGTKELVTSISNTIISNKLQEKGLIVLNGHEDGVICFAPSMPQAAEILYKAYQTSLTN